MRRPDNILFGVNDALPFRQGLALALQQLAFLGALMVIPDIYVRTQGLDRSDFLQITSATLMVSAFVILLQIRQSRSLGAGYYYPLQATSAVLPAMYLVAQLPGESMASVFGMLWVVGLSQIGFSYLIMRMRNIFTVEVSGMAVMLIGLGLGQIGLQQIFGDGVRAAHSSNSALTVAAATFIVMVGCNVWGKSLIRLMAPLLGLLAGLALSLWLGLVPVQLHLWEELSWIWVPRLPVFGWAFNAGAILPYVFTGFALALTSMGTQTIVQRTADADWVRPDLRALARGVRAEGVAHLFASLVNGLPLAASGGAVSLAAASGSVSRYLGYWTAGLLLLAAMVPKLIGTWLLLPPPVMGALLLYLATFTILNGLQLISLRMLDNRRVLAVGMGVICGTGDGVLDTAAQRLWPLMHNLTLSGLAVGICVTVVMSVIFRFGVRQGAHRQFELNAATLESVTDFLESQGRLWGTRHAPVRRAEVAGWQAVDALTAYHLVDPAAPLIELETQFDEYVFTLILSYRGVLLPLPDSPPGADALIESKAAELLMAGYLVTRSARKAQASRSDSGVCVLRLTFEN